MKKDSFKKYIFIITYGILLTFFLFNFKQIFLSIGSIFKILTPLWIGLILAIMLNVPMSLIEKRVVGKTNKKIRIMSLIFSVLVIVMFLMILFAWVIPDFINSISYLIGQLPLLVSRFNDLLLNVFRNTSLAEYLENFNGTSELMTMLTSMFKNVVNNFSGVLSNLASLLINLITGIIIAIYFLLEKEKIIEKFKLMFKKLFEAGFYAQCEKAFNLINKTFHNFISYQCLECIILGVLMFIAFSIFRFPYALTIAFLTAVTALVPIFGATVALIIGAVLIGTVNINQSIWFIIVFEVIQQIEGNLIYPRVVGKNVGLPPIITIIAIIIGGKIGGVLGMLVCIPITSVIYTIFWLCIERDIFPKIKFPVLKENKRKRT